MFIIAEVGSNAHTIDDCKESISKAKACGADAVKFQMFKPSELFGFVPDESDDQYLNVKPDWLPVLKQKADAVGIEFMCSAFSLNGLKEVDQYVNYHKMASSEMLHVKMLKFIATAKKPVFLSTAGKSLTDIEQAMKILSPDYVTLMHCVGNYPARYAWLERMNELKKFGVNVAFSDHTTSVDAVPLMAKQMGAVAIEKHVNLIDIKHTPDAAHSLNLDEFKAMCHVLRTGVMDQAPAQNDMHLKHNRRLIATADIQPGQPLVYGHNFGIFRSRKDDMVALSPILVDYVNGSLATEPIFKGEGIRPKAFKKYEN